MLKFIRKEASSLTSRIKNDLTINTEAQRIYYSEWYYSGLRNLLATSQFTSERELSEYLNIDIKTVRKTIDFLLQNGFCIREQGQIKIGPKSTHIPFDSNLVSNHHRNWRIKALEHIPLKRPESFFYTAPMSLSESTYNESREEILNLIQKLSKKIESSKSEKVACLNIDFFSY